MRIGIDARFLTHPQPGGFKTYTVNLVHALADADRDTEYTVYLDREPACTDRLPRQRNFSYRVVSGRLPAIGMPAREQLGLRLAIARDAPDLVHFLSNTATLGVRQRFVVTLHDTIQLSSTARFPLAKGPAAAKQWAMTYYSKKCILGSIRSAARIITVSRHERMQVARTLGISPERISVTHLASDPAFAKADASTRASWRAEIERQLSWSGRIVLGIGHEARKNLPLLMRAFANLSSRAADVALVLVVARDAARADLDALASDLGLSDRIRLLGPRTTNELVRLYNAADAFVFPSLRESFGLPPLEAMSCGTPTIAMKASSVPEVVEDGALLVDGNDVVEWSNAICRVLFDEPLRAQLSARGLMRASTLTWSRCAEQTLAVYRQAVAERGPVRGRSAVDGVSRA